GTQSKRPTGRKRPNPLERTLAILIQSMRGRKVVVEMKNDVEISGILEETDASMNFAVKRNAKYAQCTVCSDSSREDGLLSMVGVRQTNPNGLVRKMEMALVQGKMIRYVHIPDEVDAISNLQKHMRAMDSNAAGYRRNMLKAKPTVP
ncbi:unnamed protein product, partial [Laminaria digitata]